MQKQFFFLSPVEVVKVTSQNLEEIAEWCGGTIHETESRRVPGRMDKYVLVPTPRDKDISWAFPGMFITKRLVITVKDEIRETFAVFRRDYFDKNYFETPKDAADKTWERQVKEKGDAVLQKAKPKKQKNAEVKVTVSVGDALREAQEVLTKVKELASEAGLSDEKIEEVLTDKNIEAAHRIEQLTPAGDVPTFTHDHKIDERCGDAPCEPNRYIDGIHIFTDATTNTIEKTANV